MTSAEFKLIEDELVKVLEVTGPVKLETCTDLINIIMERLEIKNPDPKWIHGMTVAMLDENGPIKLNPHLRVIPR